MMPKHISHPSCWCKPVGLIHPLAPTELHLMHNDRIGASMGLSPLLMAGRLSEYDDGNMERHFEGKRHE